VLLFDEESGKDNTLKRREIRFAIFDHPLEILPLHLEELLQCSILKYFVHKQNNLQQWNAYLGQ